MVYLFLANGFEEVEALCPLDLLRRAGVEVTTVGIGGESVQGSHGIQVQADIPDTMFRDAKPEMIILPGGMPGAKNLLQSQTVATALKAGEKNGAYLCAICAAPMVLGAGGYLKGYKATCYPGFENSLTGADVQDQRKSAVVSDRKRITAAGMGVAFEFGLALVSALRGREAAAKIKESVINYD